MNSGINAISSEILRGLILANERGVLELLSEVNDKQSPSLEHCVEILSNSYAAGNQNLPVLRTQFEYQKQKTINLLTLIHANYENDRASLHQQEIVASTNFNIQDVEIGAGDFHNGLSTAIIELSESQKVVFKPLNGEVSHAYHHFLDWVSAYLDIGDNYKFKVFSRQDYHWLEFVDYRSIEKESQLADYYRRAGYLLCITYLLNSCDYHNENLICNGASPVLIDHETIIQPKLSSQIRNHFKSIGNHSAEESILNSMLLPIKDPELSNGIPSGLCGFGWYKETGNISLIKEGVNRFTSDWKMATRFVKQDFAKQNIPIFNGKYVYCHQYLSDLQEGFEFCYRLFLEKRTFLLGDNQSPLNIFANQKVRYLWRPTNIYARIAEQMKLPKHLTDSRKYQERIRQYLSVAYKLVPTDSKILYLLESEVSQMLRGDIPYFSINTSSRDLNTEFGKIKNFFELSCVENLERKLNKFSEKDLEKQKAIIAKSVL